MPEREVVAMQSGLRAGNGWLVVPVLMAAGALLAQQRNAPVIPRPLLGAGPFLFDTAEQHKIRVVG